MSETRSIKCDSCGKELIVDSQYPAHYSLELKAINTGVNTSGFTYSVAMCPPVDGVKHFCGKECLKNWLIPNAPAKGIERSEIPA